MSWSQVQWLLDYDADLQIDSTKDDKIYLLIPFWVTLFSVGLLSQRYVYNVLKARRRQLGPGDETDQYIGERRQSKSLIARNGGVVLFAFMAARIAGCAAIAGFSLPQVFGAASKARHSGDLSDSNVLYIYGSILAANSYALGLATAAVYCQAWRKSLIRYNILVLGSEFSILAYRNLWPLATYTRKPLDLAEGWILWARMTTLAITAFAIPLVIPNLYTPVDPKRPEKVPHPEQTASFLSLRTYSYFNPIIEAAATVTHLPASELPPLADYDRVEDVAQKVSPYIDSAKVRSGGHIAFAIMRSFKLFYFKAFLCMTLYALSHLAEPLAVNRLLTVLQSGGKDSTGMRPWFWILSMLVCPIVGSMGYQTGAVAMSRSLANTESILTQLLFEYSLKARLKADGTQKGSRSPGFQATPKISSFVGKLTNLATIDMNNLMAARELFQLIWVTPFQIIGGSIFLYTLLGWSAFVGLGVMVLSLPVPGWLTSISKNIQEEKMKKTDNRTQTVTESIQVIRMIKMFGWESKIQTRIDERREEELRWVLKGKLLDLFIQIIM